MLSSVPSDVSLPHPLESLVDSTRKHRAPSLGPILGSQSQVSDQTSQTLTNAKMLPNTPRQRSFAQALTPPHDPETKPPNTPRLQRSFVQWMTPPNDPETKPHLSPSFPSRIRRDSEQYEPKGQIGKEALDAMPSSKSGLSELLQIEDCGRDTHSVISSNEGYSVRLVHQDSTAVHNPSINPYSDGWNYRASPAPQAFDMLVDNTIPIPPSPLGLYLGNSLYIPPSPLRTVNTASVPLHEPRPLEAAVIAVHPKTKPECWEHGCNGREFQTFAGLLQHEHDQGLKCTRSDCGVCFSRKEILDKDLLSQEPCQTRVAAVAGSESQMPLREDTGQIEMDYQRPFSTLSIPSVPMKPPRAYFSNTRPVLGDRLSTRFIEGHSVLSSIHLDGPASSPATNTNLSPTASSESTLEQISKGKTGLTSDDDNTGPTPEFIPRDMLDMSERGSFESLSVSESLISLASLVESRRDIFIDRTISWIVSWIDSKLAVLAFQTHGTSEGEGSRGPPWSQVKTCGTSKRPPLEKRKGCHKGSGDEDTDGEDCMPPPSQKSGTEDKEEIVEFACPFLKHNPRRYGQIRSCSYSGWTAIYRLKEHLYRRHQKPPFQCIRCCMTFRFSEQLVQHSQAETACDVVRDESRREGISQDQLTKLKSRKRNREASTEHDKWIQVYKILFPNDYHIPSPYFQRGGPVEGQESCNLTDLREHFGRELPRLIRPQLEESVDATIREALGNGVLEGLVHDIVTQLFSTFTQKTPEMSVPGIGNTERGVAPLTAEIFPQLTLTGNDAIASHNVQAFGTEQNTSTNWAMSCEPGIEQPESSRRASQHHENNVQKWRIENGFSTEIDPGPSRHLSEDFSCFSSTTTNNMTEVASLSDLIDFEDFDDEIAAWLGQPDEASSRADSGYFSLQSGGSMENVSRKGKEKEVAKGPHQ